RSNQMDHTLDYLRESLSNWIDKDETAYRLYHKLENNIYSSERTFANTLDQEEIHYLSEIVKQEIHYAEQEDDTVRLGQLNEVFEQLY
ncbi:MAG: hypothetical protein ACO1OC_08710, partial [Tuberibacillus sp.]